MKRSACCAAKYITTCEWIHVFVGFETEYRTVTGSYCTNAFLATLSLRMRSRGCPSGRASFPASERAIRTKRRAPREIALIPPCLFMEVRFHDAIPPQSGQAIQTECSGAKGGIRTLMGCPTGS